MSLFRAEQPVLSKLRLDQSGAPAGANLAEGDVWNDITAKAILGQVNNIKGAVSFTATVNVTPVTATNPNPNGNLMSYPIGAGGLNVLGKGLYVWCAGLYTTAAVQTPTVTISVKIGSVTVLSTVSQATTAAQTNFPWNLECFINTAAIGATGTVEAHGILDILLGASATAPVSAYNDANTAVSSAIDLTAAQTLQVVGAMSSANAGNSIVQRQLYIATLN